MGKHAKRRDRSTMGLASLALTSVGIIILPSLAMDVPQSADTPPPVNVTDQNYV